MKVLVLVDGEHYPSVTKWGIDVARSMGHEVVAALFLGGTEKVAAQGVPDLGVRTLSSEANLGVALSSALEDVGPEAVLDLSDEPVLGYRERMGLIGIALSKGVAYLGPDFRFDPPITYPALPVPTLAVIGTGKRAGKTAVAGQVASTAAAQGLSPMIVAMGRGGPPEPQTAKSGSVDVGSLLRLVAEGHHAASDYLEDALVAGVTTVGARRVGGGLAGAAFATNIGEAAELAVREGAGLIVLEGSGAAVPPMPWDAGILVVPASAPPEYLGGYLGPFRLLLSDLVVFTMAAGPNLRAENLSALQSQVQRWNEDARFVVTDFEPVPLGDIRGRTVFLTTTAPVEQARSQTIRLEADAGCKVVGFSANLSDRAALTQDLVTAGDYEVLLTELKAAAVDVACRQAIDRGSEVVFMYNRAVAPEGRDLDEALREICDLAVVRASDR